MMARLLALLSVATLALATPQFNMTKCPSLHEIQKADVPTRFDMSKYLGYYKGASDRLLK